MKIKSIITILSFLFNIALASDYQFTLIIRNAGIHDIDMNILKARISYVGGYSRIYKSGMKIKFREKDYPVLMIMENGKVIGKGLALTSNHHNKQVLAHIGLNSAIPYALDVWSYEITL